MGRDGSDKGRTERPARQPPCRKPLKSRTKLSGTPGHGTYFSGVRAAVKCTYSSDREEPAHRVSLLELKLVGICSRSDATKGRGGYWKKMHGSLHHDHSCLFCCALQLTRLLTFSTSYSTTSSLQHILQFRRVDSESRAYLRMELGQCSPKDII